MPEAVVAITGASGARYGVRLLEALNEAEWDTHLIITREGAINLKLECGITPTDLANNLNVTLEDNNNLAAKSASGSAKFSAYIVCPASGTTIGKIAAGISDNLATRSALVAMKERRKLILVPRESPYSTPHLQAMANLSQWGVVILPASPGFYNQPESIEDLVDFVVARILDQLDIQHNLGKRWTGDEVGSQ
ncbi:MAG: UbiX family flavin prenyltransferase [Candidatus Thalassarchaeaceae archaeon]|jgi:4-hydroxy-3-polyprenylbenzoate decarboxylase|nr:UbiX family flavin prenyltransferase [Candidatus Thalassarchaeaceae archaeon]MDP6318298.1 UbiX family flavin prenyltransferase [Candidatus Thalassarchaeaceae archaeon]DAC35712.1 MAG TPA: UbiX family flavin prenyltransferase [Candidatus Poseidoniales archaeon]HIH79995.1 UbiX family flavin prenyltransferase [Candidatus Thalassarchaeaceae archaeon]HJM29502.1 UbiX family flavin prenyltransferase [Candidatus Thalassarchaeaceae archaeon]|tara:strand:- start:918 stop:1496 length:579 start_codon:yes stop_codon:yes gene_type:complete